MASQSATAGDYVTSSTEQCKETGIGAKPPTHAITVPGQTDQSGCVPPNKPLQSALHVATKIEENSQKPSPDENLKPPNTVGKHTSQTNSEALVKWAVTYSEDGLVLNQYPWKCELTVKLDWIQPLEINIWSKKVRNYHVFSTPKELTPIISDLKGYGLCKRPIKVEPQMEHVSEDKTDQFIDHAQALIDTAKTFVTKPVGRKQPKKQPAAKPVKSGKDPTALDVLHVMSMNKLTTLHAETDGSNCPSDADPITPKCRKIKCKMCMEIFGSVKDLNIHHKQDHGIVKCEKCEKYFSTQSSLDKHSYTHGELKFNCELCGKCFPFESRLDQHMLVHINNKLSCPKKSCDKQFKSIGDLNQHVRSHTKGGWYYCDHCDYKNKDKWNTDWHMRTHRTTEESRYECDKCGKKCILAPSSNDTMNRAANCNIVIVIFRMVLPKDPRHVETTLFCCNFHLCATVLKYRSLLSNQCT